MSNKMYASRDIMKLDFEGNYSDHVFAMTAETLYSKSDIAAELAWRDYVVAQLKDRLEQVGVSFEIDQCIYEDNGSL